MTEGNSLLQQANKLVEQKQDEGVRLKAAKTRVGGGMSVAEALAQGAVAGTGASAESDAAKAGQRKEALDAKKASTQKFNADYSDKGGVS